MKVVDGISFLSLDLQQFRKVCDVEKFYGMLEEKPKDALLCMSAAVHEVQSYNYGVNNYSHFINNIFSLDRNNFALEFGYVSNSY